MSRGIGPIATNTATTSLPMAPALPAPGVLKTKFEKHEEEQRQKDLAAIGNRSQPDKLGKRILTDDEVIALRKKEAETGWPYKKLRQWFEFYELGDGTLCSLCRGHRRKDLPMFERKRTRTWKPLVTPEIRAQIKSLRGQGLSYKTIQKRLPVKIAKSTIESIGAARIERPEKEFLYNDEGETVSYLGQDVVTTTRFVRVD